MSLSRVLSRERSRFRTKTYIVLLPWRSWRRSLQLFPAFALAWPTLVRWRMVVDVPVTTGPGPGLGVRDADGRPRRESRTSSRVVEPGLGLFRRRAAVAIASSVSLWPDPNRFHAWGQERVWDVRVILLASIHCPSVLWCYKFTNLFCRFNICPVKIRLG